MKKLNKKKLAILIGIIVLIVIEIIAFGLSRSRTIKQIQATFIDVEGMLENKVNELSAVDGGESGYYIALPEIVEDKHVTGYIITEKKINEENNDGQETEEENGVQKLPGDKIYLTEEEFQNGTIEISVVYDTRTTKDVRLYNKIVEGIQDDKKVSVKGYMPEDALLMFSMITDEKKTEIGEVIKDFLYDEIIIGNLLDIKILSNDTEYDCSEYNEALKVSISDNENPDNITNYIMTSITEEAQSSLVNILNIQIKNKEITFEMDKLAMLVMIGIETEDSGWDGEVSNHFASGNGTEQNPYTIHNPGQLAYLKTLLEGEEAEKYNTKYYKLINDMDLGGKEIVINNTLPFMGTFDGDAYFIRNGFITSSFFALVEEGTIQNINFENIVVENSASEISALLVKQSKNSVFENITVSMNYKIIVDTYVGTFLGIDEGSTIRSVVLNANYEINEELKNIDTLEESEENETRSIVDKIASVLYEGTETKIENVLIKKNEEIDKYFVVDKSVVIDQEENELQDLSPITETNILAFTVENNIIAIEEHDITEVLEEFTASEDYHFIILSGDIVVAQKPKMQVSTASLDDYTISPLAITVNNSGIQGDTVYVNDLEADWNYYKGLNYVESDDGTLPTGENQNIYNESNLVRTKITYSGIQNLNGITYTGTVSFTEAQSKYVYYNYYHVENGKVKIELIDNPFTNRPTDRAFNNWASDDNIGTISYDSAYHKRYIEVDVSYTGGIPDDIEINLHASWVEATAYAKTNSTATATGTVGCWTYIFNNLKAKGPTVLTASNYYNGQSMAGYYLRVNLAVGESLVGYYSSTGAYLSSGTSTNASTVYYRMIQNYDSDRIYNASNTYYYMVTRDTNIIYLTSAFTTSSTAAGYNWTSALATNKPFTFTGVHNGVNYDYTWTITSYITLYSDVTIENLRITCSANSASSSPATTATTARYIYGNFNNLKMGRGIIKSGNYKNLVGIIASSATTTTGSASNLTKYNLMVESGYYDSIVLANTAGTSNMYIDAKGVYGNDYDRVTNNNSNLDVYYVAAGAFGGTIRSSTVNGVAIHATVKCGSFGTGKADAFTGIYVGGRGAGVHNAIRSIKIEGGWVYNLIGGPYVDASRAEINDVFIYMTGGSVDIIFGGASANLTYGHRIISITGGTVNYSVFTGSNGSTGTGDNGRLMGSGFVYVGGNARIGNASYVSSNSALYGSEAGSVFGIGNGRSGASYTSIGSNDNSNIIIDGNATILRNVYGGGNYGATGIVSSKNTNTTNIQILGGTINGDVYGGGNQNGAGSSTKIATVNITMKGGTVVGNVYGGSNVTGTIYGDVNLNVLSGQINANVYGGGKGGTGSTGNFVSGNVAVDIGSSSTNPTINGSVYGGSAFGSVNGTTNTTNVSSSTTNVTVQNATIGNSVFGGGQGNASYTPYVMGNITVTINNGNIGYVYGGNDQAGTPNGSIKVYLNNGTIGESYGGGNSSSVKTSEIYLQGATTNYLFGGSNTSGTVTTSNVLVTSGTVGTVFGGNNAGGQTTTTNVTINGGIITGEVYGGGRQANSGTTNVNLNNLPNTLSSVYGGGYSADATTTRVNLQGMKVTSIFGGSNTSGTVGTSNVTLTSGTVETAYGGNNAGGRTNTTNITLNGCTINNVYGGGRQADSGETNVTLNSAANTLTSVYGGGYSADAVKTNVNAIGVNVTSIFGGSNTSGTVSESNVIITTGIMQEVYGGNNAGGLTNKANVTINGGTITDVFGGGNNAESGGITVIINNGTISNAYAGGNLAEANTPYIEVNNGNIGNVFGGGNQADVSTTNVRVNGGTINNLYGGGNAAGVLNDTRLTAVAGTITTNVYGGGEEGIVTGNTNVNVSNITIGGSLYAGGNGVTAIVYGNTNLKMHGNTIVGTETSVSPVSGCVFGGGNAAATGVEGVDNSSGTVNIAGGTIYGNIYGGANTSVIYGEAVVNIGYESIGDNTLLKEDIYIKGTIFGGGEANASGSEIYDYSFISVTKGINMNIDGSGHDRFITEGSIFGSGNASSTSGESEIYIKDFGTNDDPQRNISIQRATLVTLDKSAMVLNGATDRTNEYSNEYFSISRVDEVKLKNGSTLYLNYGGNLLKKLSSLVDVGGIEVKGAAIIDETTGTTVKNVDNRIYMREGRNLNIATSETLGAFGEVNGMTFLGLYSSAYSPVGSTGPYHFSYDNNDVITNEGTFSNNSYVRAMYKSDLDISVDGFYTNYNNDGRVKAGYIGVTEEGEQISYIWLVGENMDVTSFDIILTASKYATLGTTELQLLGFGVPNTRFILTGFSAGLQDEVSLIDKTQIPSIADTADAADTVFGLGMRAGNNGWQTGTSTQFYTANGGSYNGSTIYNHDNSSFTPILSFYLYHSQNLSLERDLGEARIRFQVLTPIDDLNYNISYVDINVTMFTALYPEYYYEAAISPGEEFELFTTTQTDITNKSKFSTYYALYIDKFSTSDYASTYFNSRHVLVSRKSDNTPYVFPAGTRIIMIDEIQKKYYYYVVTASDENTNKYMYRISDFIGMGSDNEPFNETAANSLYYNSAQDIIYENFIFQVNFKETDIQTNMEENTLLIELQEQSGQTLLGVLGHQRDTTKYSIYTNNNASVNTDGEVDPNVVYLGQEFNLNLSTEFAQSIVNSKIVYDTQYFNYKMGLKITILDANENQLNSDSLLGITFTLGNAVYYPKIDGVISMTVADKLSNVLSKIKVDTKDNTRLATGTYTIRVEAFGSPDGICYGMEPSPYAEFTVDIINGQYGLKAYTQDSSKIVDKETGFTLDKTNVLETTLEYMSALSNPSITVSLERRDYQTQYSMTYNKVDLQEYITETLTAATNEHEYLYTEDPQATSISEMTLKENLTTGTYKLKFKLYNNSTYIGEAYEYFIIK